MKKLLLFFILVTYNLLSSSQELILKYNEEFNDNKNEWSVSSSDVSSSEISGGFFTIQNKSKDQAYRYWNSFSINEEEDFAVEVKIKQLTGAEDAGFGMFFLSNGIDENYNFEIKSSGYYRTSNKIGGSYDNETYKETKGINKKGEYNILKVKKSGEFIYYYINDKLVNVKKYEGKLGENYGFVLRETMKAQVDYIKIWTKEPQINVSDNQISGQKENLGSGINSKYSELIPVISPDGKTLYFCRDGHPGNTGSSKDHNDIWYATFDGTNWSNAQNIGKPLNNSGHNYVIWISPDNNKIIVNGTYTAFGETDKNGISLTTKNDDGSWSIPKTITITDFRNDGQYQNFTISSDLQVIIMACRRDGDTYGENDIYVSFRNNDGTYTKPKNIGNVVNTAKTEGTPFLAPDNTTLYFYSYGHAGYGSGDIFLTKRLDNTWLNWSKPENLGPNINSEKWDAYYTTDAKGEFAYFVSSSNSIGEEDIFKMKVQEQIKPEITVLVKGRVIDKKTNQPLAAQIFYDNLTENVKFDIANSNSRTGLYQIILPAGKKYGFYAKKQGYLPLSDNLDFTNVTEYKEITRDLYLVPIEQEEMITLNNIFFPKGKAELLTSSYAELDRLVEILKTNPSMVIEVQGHTNNIGDRTQLIDLSQRRANAVKDYLVKQGIDEKRIQTKGFGPDKPIATNSTEEGRQKNQRVEFKIVKK